VLRAEGSANFTLRDLARRVGVSHAAPYAHFADKRALLAAVATIGFRNLLKKLEEAAASSDDPFERLAAIGWAYVRFGYEDPAHYRLMFTVPELRRYEGLPDLEQAAHAAFAVVLRVLGVLHQEGLIRPGDERVDALTAWALVHGITLLTIDERTGIDGGAPGAVERFARSSIATMIAGLVSRRSV
jgi:AcrR family transcriptional regulator